MLSQIFICLKSPTQFRVIHPWTPTPLKGLAFPPWPIPLNPSGWAAPNWWDYLFLLSEWWSYSSYLPLRSSLDSGDCKSAHKLCGRNAIARNAGLIRCCSIRDFGRVLWCVNACHGSVDGRVTHLSDRAHADLGNTQCCLWSFFVVAKQMETLN